MKFIIGVVLAGMFAALLIVPFVGIHYETGRGEHTGFVTAIETSGIIWKTGTAYVKTDAQSSQEDVYCVVDDSVYKQLEEYARTRKQVNIYHFSWLNAGITECGAEGAVIYKVEPIAAN